MYLSKLISSQKTEIKSMNLFLLLALILSSCSAVPYPGVVYGDFYPNPGVASAETIIDWPYGSHVYYVYEPKPDITAFELAKIIPLMMQFGDPLRSDYRGHGIDSDMMALGTAVRHFVRHDRLTITE